AHVESPRIVLRPFHPADAPALSALFARNREHAHWTGAVSSDLFAVLDHIRACIEDDELGHCTSFAVLLSGEIIGGAEIVREGDVAGLGYWIGVDHQGHGYATEAAAALAHVALVLGIVGRVRIRCAADNGASVAVARHIGCRFGAPEDGVGVGECDLDAFGAAPAGALEVAAVDAAGRTLLGRPRLGPRAAWDSLVAALHAQFGDALPISVAPVTAGGEPAAAFTATIAPERCYG